MGNHRKALRLLDRMALCVMVVNMKTVTTREAQHHLARVLEYVEQGEKIIITRRGVKVAKLEPYHRPNPFKRSIDWKKILLEINPDDTTRPPFKDCTTDLLRSTERY